MPSRRRSIVRRSVARLGEVAEGIPAPLARQLSAGLRGALVAAALLHPIAIGAAMLFWSWKAACFGVIFVSIGLALPRHVLLARTPPAHFFVVVEHATLVWVAWLAWMVSSPRLLMSIPVLASLYMAARIAASLFESRTFVEEWSRRVDLDFPDFKTPYCLAVTVMWCAFFAGHSTVMLWIVARGASIDTWLLYTGVVFHASAVALLAAEYLFRQWWFRDYGFGPLSRLFARLFPAENSERGRRSLAWRNSHRYRLADRDR